MCANVPQCRQYSPSLEITISRPQTLHLLPAICMKCLSNSIISLSTLQKSVHDCFSQGPLFRCSYENSAANVGQRLSHQSALTHRAPWAAASAIVSHVVRVAKPIPLQCATICLVPRPIIIL